MNGIVPLTKVTARGAACTVECVVRATGEAPAEQFLLRELEQIREKGKCDPQGSATARFLVLFQMMANYGRVSPKRFKKEMGKLFAFRHEVRNLQIRFPCFQDGNKWILTHGFIKPGARKKLGDWPESEIRPAEERMAEYWRRKSGSRL
jgi:hypothetical protein